METEKIMTAAQVKGHYDPMPATFIIIKEKGEPAKIYGYDFNRLTFLQIMLAEEKAQWKKDQIEAHEKDYRVIEASGSTEYALDLASILFTPATIKKIDRYTRGMDKETKAVLENMQDEEQVKTIERALNDFFTRRGKRRLALTTLTRAGNFDKTLSMLMQQGLTFLSSSSDKNDFSSPGNTPGELKSESGGAPSAS